MSLYAAILFASALSVDTSSPLAPTLCFDEAHHNVHTAVHGYNKFADLATAQGYILVPLREHWTKKTLETCQLLVVVSPRGAGPDRPLKERGIPPFSSDELSAFRNWLAPGRSFFLATDHPPIGSASRPLADAIAVQLSDAFTEDPDRFDSARDCIVFSRANGGLGHHPILEDVQSVATFLGESLVGPPGSIPLLVLGPRAIDRMRRSDGSVWLDSSPSDPTTSAAGRAQAIALVRNGARAVVLGEAGLFTSLPGQPGISTEGFENQQFATGILRWLGSNREVPPNPSLQRVPPGRARHRSSVRRRTCVASITNSAGWRR